MTVPTRDKRELFYESFASEYDSATSHYDTQKRLEVVYNEMLTEDISGKKLLDAGCGTGWFSKWAADRNAMVTSMDLGEKLLAEVAKKCRSQGVVGSILEMPFGDNTFDIVVSSEVIEHTPEPCRAIREMYRVLKPQGTLILTTPNKIWYFSVWLANFLKIRPFEGYENWLGWHEMRRELRKSGFYIEEMVGIHLFPFVFPPLNPLLDVFHRFNKLLGPVMINMAARCRKWDWERDTRLSSRP